MKCLILGTYASSMNIGQMSIIVSTFKEMKKIFPDLKFSLISQNFDHDSKKYKKYGINTVKAPNSLLSKFFFIFLVIFYRLTKCKLLEKYDIIREIFSADIAITLSGDIFSDNYGYLSTFSFCYYVMLAKLAKKPVFICAESIGPFKSFLTKESAKLIINLSDIISVREKISMNYLRSLGIKKKIHMTADMAFLLNSLEVESKRIEKKVVGINISAIIHKWCFPDILDERKKYKLFVDLFSRFIDYISEKYNFKILLIPHSYEKNKDDRKISLEIYKKIKNPKNVRIIKNYKFPEEMKRLISSCDLFVATRMHASISATSLYIPTLVLAYSHKFNGIIGDMVGLKKYVIDVRECYSDDFLDQLKNKFDELLNNKNNIRMLLIKKISRIKKRSSKNIELIYNFCKKRGIR